MSSQSCTILGIIIAGGALGGLVSAFISEDEQLSWGFCTKRIVIGIGSAFVVPLFLNMISSTLLEKAETTPSSYFVFAGFCIIAAIASKAFISSVSAQLIRQVKDVKEEVREVKASVEPILVKETEPEQPSLESGRRDILKSISDAERKLLEALNSGKYSMRTLGGISKEAELDLHVAAGHMSQLQNSGLAAKASGENKKSLWYLTQLGKETIEGT